MYCICVSLSNHHPVFIATTLWRVPWLSMTILHIHETFGRLRPIDISLLKKRIFNLPQDVLFSYLSWETECYRLLIWNADQLSSYVLWILIWVRNMPLQLRKLTNIMPSLLWHVVYLVSLPPFCPGISIRFLFLKSLVFRFPMIICTRFVTFLVREHEWYFCETPVAPFISMN